MHSIRLKISLIIISIIVIVFGANALPLDFFDSSSSLSKGLWVKIGVSENGIYEISYDQLRQMGFSDPKKVGVYGRGGAQLSENFKEYSDKYQPVAVLHTDDKIYFYGQGPISIRYRSEYGDPVDQRFKREFINTYSDLGHYFLTDSRNDVLHISLANAKPYDSTLPHYDTCYDYFLHEQDLTNFCQSGRLFVGESFEYVDKNTQTFDYEIPGAIAGSASFEYKFYDTNSSQSSLCIDINGRRIVDAKIAATAQNYFASSADNTNSHITIDSPSGKVTFAYSPGKYASQSYLDYFLIGASKKIGFHNEQSQFRAFVPKYNSSEYGAVAIKNATSSTIVWDIIDNSKIVMLPYTLSDSIALVSGLTENKDKGMMMVFDSDKRQMQIDEWHVIHNQDLHSISSEEVPNMLIITVPYLHEKAQQLAELHRIYDKIDVMVVNSDEIINEFSAGTPDAMAYRAFCKMLYDRNPSKLKNLLLFGEMHYDNRQILRHEKGQRLLSYQTEESLNMMTTHCVSDFYGMLEDTPSTKGMHNNVVNIGVGELPCRSLADADMIIKKVEHYLTDNSYAYWLGNAMTIGDGPDYNEHLNHAESIASENIAINDNQYCINRLYVSAYPPEQVSRKMKQCLNNGVVIGSYLGHAAIESLSSNRSVWTTKETSHLSNKHLAFFNIGACTTTMLDAGIRGSTEAMLFGTRCGIIGGMMPTRKTYSYWNYLMLSTFQQALFQKSPSSAIVDSSLSGVSTPKTIGEIYAQAKSLMQSSNNNEFAYHLVCDPAITLPIATTNIVAEIDAPLDNNNTPSLSLGSTYHLRGNITDRQGNHLENFNGNLVAKLFDTPSTIKTNGYIGSTVVDVTYDEQVLSTYAAEIIDGHFECDIVIPTNITTPPGSSGILRLSAYDSAQRIGSIGAIDIIYGSYDPSKATTDTIPPTISNMSLNSPDFKNGDKIANNAILYATIIDDTAIAPLSQCMTNSTYLQLDGKKIFNDLSQYITFSRGGSQCNIIYPIENLTEGLHSLTLNIADVMGNKVRHSITFHVIDNPLNAEIIVETTPIRDYAEFKIICETIDISKEIIITDITGEIVHQATTSSETYIWDTKNFKGEKVSPGVYHLYCRLKSGNTLRGVTPKTTLYVIDTTL